MENTILLLLATIIGCVDAWDVCYYKKYYIYSSQYGSLYCPDSCCGYYTNRQCCYRLSGGTIAGAVVGGLIFLAVIVAVVICIVLKNKRGARGTVVAPQGQITTVAMVQNQQQLPPGYHAGYNYPQPMQYHPPPPPGQQSYPPPNLTSGINPAYPMAPPPAYPPGPAFPAQQGYESAPNGIPPKS